jgi:hypothetical protein
VNIAFEAGGCVGAGVTDVDVDGVVVVEEEELTSGLPSERSPMLGSARGSRVQYWIE